MREIVREKDRQKSGDGRTDGRTEITNKQADGQTDTERASERCTCSASCTCLLLLVHKHLLDELPRPPASITNDYICRRGSRNVIHTSRARGFANVPWPRRPARLEQRQLAWAAAHEAATDLEFAHLATLKILVLAAVCWRP